MNYWQFRFCHYYVNQIIKYKHKFKILRYNPKLLSSKILIISYSFKKIKPINYLSSPNNPFINIIYSKLFSSFKRLLKQLFKNIIIPFLNNLQNNYRILYPYYKIEKKSY